MSANCGGTWCPPRVASRLATDSKGDTSGLSSEKGFQLEEFGDASEGNGSGILDLGEVTNAGSLEASEVGLGTVSSAASATVDASLTSPFASQKVSPV